MVGDEVLNVTETDVSGDQHFMFVRHTGFIQVTWQYTHTHTLELDVLAQAQNRAIAHSFVINCQLCLQTF